MLEHELGDREAALAVLRQALTQPTRRRITRYLLLRFGISQRHPERAFERMSRTMKGRGESLFGAYWLYEDAGGGRGERTVAIRRCLFNDFLAASGAPELTPLFCALDSVWADELADPKYGVRFARPTTLAEGDDACRFQFTRESSSA